jgi:hypothetical protein
MNNYQCPKCGAEFAIGTKFCQNCGCNLKAEVIENPTCPKCHKTFPTGTKFCDTDGSKLVSPDKLIPQCVKCGKAYTDGTKFCPNDGGRVVLEALRPPKPPTIIDIDPMPSKTGTLGKIALVAAILAAVIDLYILLSFSSSPTVQLGGMFVGKKYLFVIYLREMVIGWVIVALLLAGVAKFIDGVLITEDDRNSEIANTIAYYAGGLAVIFLLLAIFAKTITGY